MYKAGVYEIIPLKDKLNDYKLIKLIWSFKYKRSSIGVLMKYIARLYVHRGIQEKGIDYFNTFIPVVN